MCRIMPGYRGESLCSGGGCCSESTWGSPITRHSLVRVYRLLRKPRSRSRLENVSFIAKVGSLQIDLRRFN